MIITLYYMTATIFQSWRLKTICTKIAKQLSTKASVVFYKVEGSGELKINLIIILECVNALLMLFQICLQLPYHQIYVQINNKPEYKSCCGTLKINEPVQSYRSKMFFSDHGYRFRVRQASFRSVMTKVVCLLIKRIRFFC